MNCLLSSWTSISRLLNSFSSLRIAAWGAEHTHTKTHTENNIIRRPRPTVPPHPNHLFQVSSWCLWAVSMWNVQMLKRSHLELLRCLQIISINLQSYSLCFGEVVGTNSIWVKKIEQITQQHKWLFSFILTYKIMILKGFIVMFVTDSSLKPYIKSLFCLSSVTSSTSIFWPGCAGDAVKSEVYF